MDLAGGQLLGAAYESWTLGLAIASFVVVIVATAAALRQLRALARQGRFTGAVEFQRLTREHEGRVVRILRDFPIVDDPAEIDELPDELVAEAKLVINSVNDNGQLLEEGLLAKPLYFGLYHTQLIRLVFLLRPLMAWEEQRSGGRYGRRLLRLDARARHYHDMRAMHRSTVVKLTRGDECREIYRTRSETGWQGLRQRLRWRVRWALNRY